ncbi:S4 domain-containing protein YaaA [Streptococcus troglodytae]|uniref:S4 domain-containing protein YaaA n=1 Tax=Streptococcus troglodytae TaxID=1111760 RepID=A0A1L7LM99_9STRE|nr:S4 domain-containing protein YaaA [Streptococcus troglodytae]BAQ25333.1 S4 domain-containing protein YaaA [Streptococcus troglodytae]
MEYKLFSDYITLQALLKNLGIIPSGGAIKSYLANTEILFNGQPETRRGKKLRLGDQISIPNLDIFITIIKPSSKERDNYLKNLAEKERVAAFVKKLNKLKKQQNKQKTSTKPKKTIKFPGT